MFALTEGDNSKSDEVLLEMVKIQEEILQQLELPYRVLNMAS